MTDQPPPTSDEPESTIDAEIADLLDRYLTDRRQGTAIDRDRWLGQHPEHADRLAECLDAADLFGGAETGGFDLPREPGLPDTIGDFEILGELGRGGMGVVYEAREKSLDRIVALKVMRFGIVDPTALDRFRREAETAGALHHTNIVPVFATGREADTSWYAMQRIEGESLASRLKRARRDAEPIEVDRILDVGIQTADALGHAHQRDVIHRDVKPANLILDHEQRVWLTDFGLARRLADVSATVTGAILGTPRYMSPEQADWRTAEVDHRSDIYSLGATLYEMATGRPPFEGDDPLQLLTRIRYEEPPTIRHRRANLPRDLEVVLRKAMEKDPKRRYQSAGELSDDLRAIRDDYPIRARPLSVLEKGARFTRKHQTRMRIAALAMAATTVLIAAMLLGWNHWNQSRLGAFRIRAGGGPYQTTLFPVGETQLSDAALDLTIPMQNHQKLLAGDYDMIVSAPGRWSQTLRLPVTKGIPSEYRLTRNPAVSTEISIDDAIAVTVAGDQDPAIIWRQDGKIMRVTLDADDRWQRDVSAVQTQIVSVGGSDRPSDTETTTVNFAETFQSLNFKHGHHLIDDAPLLTQGAAALRTFIDLDGDGRSDTLIAATNQQALLAIDHRGEIIWSRAYSFAGLPIQSDLPDPLNSRASLPFPGVFDLQDAGDQDGDGINDVFAMFVHLQWGVQTDVCLITLSGKTGDSIDSMVQTLVVKDGTQWPTDGVFNPRDNQRRSFASLSFQPDRVLQFNPRRVSDFRILQRPRSTPIRIAVPSPPILLHDGGRFRVVQLTGDQCQIIAWENDKETTTIKLPFVPAHAPIVARSRAGVRLIFHEPNESISKQMRQPGTDVLAYDLSGNLCWKQRLTYVDWMESVARNDADWPLVVDVDGDGNDEVVLPRSRYRNGVELGVRMHDSESGDSLWPVEAPNTAFQSAERCLTRMTVSEDLDHDGWREIATASLSGPGSPRGTQSATSGKVYVYIDWISGKTGDRVAWARHALPMVGEGLRVAQIDAIRSNLPNALDGTIEIDVISGDRHSDVMLDSAVVRFHPRQPGIVSIAAGLDVCPSSTDATSPVRVYRRRSGPFGVGEDDLVLLPFVDGPAQRIGESRLLASWSGGAGRSLVAASGFQPTRLSVIDAKTHQTVWSSDRQDADGAKWIPVQQDDGTVDFLVQTQRGIERPANFVDGDTGKKLFELSDIVGGEIVWSRVVHDGKSLLIVGDGRLRTIPVPTALRRNDNAFRMNLVSMSTGVIRWSRKFLLGASQGNYPQRFDHLQLADLSGDGLADIVGSHSHDDELFLCAWDGASGEKRWELPMHQRPTATDYWIPFSTIDIDGRAHVVYFGRPDEDSVERKLVCCDSDGHQIYSATIDQASRIPLVSASRSHQHFAIADVTPAADRPRIAVSRELAGRYQCTVFDLGKDGFQVAERFKETAKREYAVGMWFRDVDGDGFKERLLINRVVSDPQQSAYSESLSLKCFSMQSSTSMFEAAIADADDFQAIDWKNDHGVPVSCLRVDRDRIVVVDWSRGKILATAKAYAADPRNLPLVCDVKPDATSMAFSSLDGIQFGQTGATRRTVSTPTEVHDRQDPRRTRKFFESVGGAMTLSEWTIALLRGGVALAVLVVIPLWYLASTIRARRWSLSWMMLLPIVVCCWLLVWRSEWLHETNWILVLLQGVTMWMCVAALFLVIGKSAAGPSLSLRWMLAFGIPLVVLGVACFEYRQTDDRAIRYTFDMAGLIRVALLSFTIVVQIYWLLRIPYMVVKWLSGFRRRTVTA